MKNRYKLLILMTIVLSLFVSACGNGDLGDSVPIDEDIASEVEIELHALKEEVEALAVQNENLNKEKEELRILNEDLEIQGANSGGPSNSPQTLLALGMNIMELIRDKDLTELSNHVHPSKGLRFTPLVHIVVGRDQEFTSQELAGLDQDTTVYNWGYYKDSPDEIMLDFNDYYEEFIYDEDYANPDIIGINTIVNTGGEIDNVHDSYPNGEFLEFMIVGEENQYGSDWRSLKLVFEKENGVDYLVGIVRGQWIFMNPQ